MKNHNSKLKIILVVVLLLVFSASLTYANHKPGHEGLVPCSGLDCSFCDLFSLIQNIFNFVVKTLVPLIAVGGVVWGGYTYLTSAGKPEKDKQARGILKNTFLGLAVVYASFLAASFLIGFLVSGSLTGSTDSRFSFSGGTFDISCRAGGLVNKTGDLLKNGKVTITVPKSGDTVPGGQNLAVGRVGLINTVGNVNLSNLSFTTHAGLDVASADKNLADKGILLLATSGFRSYDQQLELAKQNCGNPPNKSSCSTDTCIPSATNPAACPPTSGKAVDVWGTLDGKSNCAKDSSCQQEVIKAMRAQGFCVLASEPWHFEKPPVSSSCK